MSNEPGLPQYLNWRGFVAPGVIKNVDGAFLTAWELHGPDQEYADYLGMEYLAEQINRDLSKFSSGWVMQAEAIQVPIVIPPAHVYYPEPTSQLVADERAEEYATEGKHFVTRHVLTLTWLPPSDTGQSLSQYLFGKRWVGTPSGLPNKGSERGHTKQSHSVLLSIFETQAELVVKSIAGLGLVFHRLTDEELKSFLWCCLTGEDRSIGSNEDGSQLNYALGATKMRPWRGTVGKMHTRVVGVYGFPKGSYPQMLDNLVRLPFALRVSQRFIFLGNQKAIKELQQKRNTAGYPNWYNLKKVGWGATQNITKSDPNSEEVVERDDDADEQVRSIQREITELRSGDTRGGYYTLIVVLHDEDEEVVEQHAAEVILLLNRMGFTAVIETDNFPAAIKGSLTGHGTSNVRKPRFTARHLARFWLTSSPWRGPDTHPSPLYPPGSGPLLICKSTGLTPFNFSPALHFFVIGPTGNGKSVLFNSMAMAQLQYPNAQVNIFDLGASSLVPTLACGGEYYDLHGQRFSPLAHIDQPDELSWALDYLVHCAKLQDFPMTPRARADLRRALDDLSLAPIKYRTMTGLLNQLQTHEAGLSAALSYYAGTNPGAMLDGTYSPLAESHWLTYDMEQLRKYSEAVRGPALMAQIHALERRMDGRSTLMLFEEGWVMGEEEILRLFLEEESATARKKAVSIGLVLHSPGDLNIFPHADRLRNNITTKIFLPNPEADTDGVRQHYADMGLGRREIKMIASPSEMRPRLDYYMVEGQYRRKFQLPWGPWTAALLGVNGRDHKARILQFRKEYGADWLPVWLTEMGHDDLAQQRRNYRRQKEAA